MHLTNLAENMLVDMTRGQGLTLSADFDIALLTAASESSYTEAAWSGYARIPRARSLSAWAGTQGAGTTAASTGTSHQTSNNAAVDFGVVGSGGSGTATHIGLFLSGTNDLFCYAPLQVPIAISPTTPIEFAPGAILFTLGATGGMSDYLSNRLIDLIWRGQAWAWPNNTYLRLMTAAPGNGGGGTEVAPVGGYAQQILASTLAFWSGTQGPGTTTASTGTSGRTSNNAAVVFPAPAASWGTVTHMAINDALGGGNLLFWAPMADAKSVLGGGPAPRFNADSLGVTFA